MSELHDWGNERTWRVNPYELDTPNQRQGGQSQSKQGERDEPMTFAEFGRWAETIGLSAAQLEFVWYVIRREYDRGKLAGLAAKRAEGRA